MVHLSKIVTKGGDTGKTSLGDGSRVRKDDPRIDAIGSVDELNAVIGVLMSFYNTDEQDIGITKHLEAIQNDLFDVGADLCVPYFADKPDDRLRVTDEHILRLEGWVEDANKGLQPLDSFVLPGGTILASMFHWARTVARRAERHVVHADNTYGMVHSKTVVYLNRLSDLFFVWSRLLNKQHGLDVLWRPGGEK